MIVILVFNLIIFLSIFFLTKKFGKNFYFKILLIYLLIISFNFLYLNEKLVVNSIDELWLSFSFLTLVITLFSWLHGIITKSVSIRMLNYINDKKKISRLNKITEEIVESEFEKRIKILRKRKLIIFRHNKYKITIQGSRFIKNIIKIRKFFNIRLINFYFGKQF